MSTTDGTISTIATIDSDDCPTTSGTGENCNATFTDSSYNTSSYYYYVRVDISRDSTSNSEYFYGATLY
jgi:hypothetical protein